MRFLSLSNQVTLAAAIALLAADATIAQCQSLNGNGGTNQSARSTASFAFRMVAAQDMTITGFQLFNFALSNRNVATQVYMATSSGEPSLIPAANGTMFVTKGSAWRKTVFTKPFNVTKGQAFYVSHSGNSDVNLPVLTSGTPTTSYYYNVNQKRWALTSSWRAAIRIDCTSVCAGLNTSGGTLRSYRSSVEIAYRLVAPEDMTIPDFSFYNRALTTTQATAYVRLAGSGGLPGTIVATGAMSFTTATAWRKANLTKPVFVKKGQAFYVGHLFNTNVNQPILTSGTTTINYFYHTTQKRWIRLTDFAAAIRIECPRLRDLTSPPGFVSTEAPNYSSVVGAYPNEHWQYADGNRKGSSLTIYELQMRPDFGVSPNNSAARKWSNVTVKGAETDYNALSSTFASNFKTAASTVFSGAFNLAQPGTRPAKSPRPWGTIRVPFTKPYVYTGSRDLLWDFTFSGGTLANNAKWTHSPFYLDGLHVPTSASSLRLYGSNTTCKDSGQASSPYSYLYVNSFGTHTGNATTANKFGFGRNTVNGPKNGTMLAGLSVTGNTNVSQWTKLPGVCQGLGIGPLLLVEAVKLDSNGRAIGTQKYIPYRKAWVGIKLYNQGAYSDSRTGAFSLSAMLQTTIQPQPAPVSWKAKHMYSTSATSATGFGFNQSFLPVLLYEAQ